jgi:ubiquinone/menaquinone biosynthesis C-methylase UbiE
MFTFVTGPVFLCAAQGFGLVAPPACALCTGMVATYQNSPGRSAARVLRTFTAEWGEALEEVTCPLCGADDAELALESSDLLYGKPGVYRLVRCRGCKLEYVNPRPTFEALGAHYPDDYISYQAPEADPTVFRGLSEAISRSMIQKRLARLERVIGRIPPDYKIVDVGCGLNDLLATIKRERGPEGIGVDLKQSMVERIQKQLGMPAVLGTLEQARFPDGQLDLVTMLEYLEHESNPKAVLAESRRVLKKGGYVGIEIPHVLGLPARFFKDRWFNLDLPRHLVFFDPETLRRALADTGFELVSYEPYTIPTYIGISVLFKLGGVRLGRNALAPLLGSALGVPFLPFQRFLPELAFAVGRAV